MQNNKKTFYLIYILGFLCALATALPSYMQSSFLEQFVDLKYIGLYLSLATFVTMLVIFIFPRFIRKFGNYKIMMTILFVFVISVGFLVKATNGWLVLIFFTSHYLCLSLMAINLDVFLENISDDEHTGHIRTVFLTVMNAAWVISPFLMGQLTGENNRYWLVYLVSGLVMLPAIVILFMQKKLMIDHIHYKSRHFHELLAVFKYKKNISRIFSLAFALRFFYCLMVLYTPIYLHEAFGFSWVTIGIMFTVMLLPFVILQMPAGNLADRYFGEKEILIVGIIIMMIATGSIFFIQSNSPFVWTAVLFMSRVGASLVESMSEVYFFKKVDREDMDLINLFRDLRPAGWLLGSLVSVLILKFLPISYIFLFVVLVLLISLRPALALEDTK